MLENERRSTPLYKKFIFIIVSLVLLIIQIVLLYFSIVVGFMQAKAVSITVMIIGYCFVFWILNSDSTMSYKVTWIILITLLPVFFSVLYLMNNSAKKMPKRKVKKIENYLKTMNFKFDDCGVKDNDILRLANLVYADTRLSMYKNTQVYFFNDAAFKHVHMLNCLKNAKKYIFMQYFIISDGKLMDELIPILASKAKEGVQIKILYDDIGSKKHLSKKTINRLLNIKGLELCVYNPLGLELNPVVNYRNHQKMTIVDGLYAYCGGDNLADEYVHYKTLYGYWRDNACFYEGEAVNGFLKMFLLMWYMSSQETLKFRDYIVEDVKIKNNSLVIPFMDGPHGKTNIAYDSFLSLINSANKSIYLSTPYLIIDDQMINALVIAKKSGIDVKILVPGIPDKKTVYLMTRAHYKDLLRAGIEIYEYSPGFNHAKNLIIDDRVTFCGTINMDYRSMFLHYECGAFIVDDKIISDMKNDFIGAIEKSKLVTLEVWNKRNIFGRFLSFLLRLFSPML